MSKWKLEDAKRHQLPLRGDQDGLTQLFYLRRNVITAKVDMPGTPFFAVNAHLTAFATDDTKQKHISGFKTILDNIVASGFNFVAGGDLNAIPPNALITVLMINVTQETTTQMTRKVGAILLKRFLG